MSVPPVSTSLTPPSPPESKGIIGSVTDMFSSAATAVSDGVGHVTKKVGELAVPSATSQGGMLGTGKEGVNPMLGGRRRKSKKTGRRGRKSMKGKRSRKTRKH
jgi:hypothetical protein